MVAEYLAVGKFAHRVRSSVIGSKMSVSGRVKSIGNESVPMQLAERWFPGLAIFNAKI